MKRNEIFRIIFLIKTYKIIHHVKIELNLKQNSLVNVILLHSKKFNSNYYCGRRSELETKAIFVVVLINLKTNHCIIVKFKILKFVSKTNKLVRFAKTGQNRK